MAMNFVPIFKNSKLFNKNRMAPLGCSGFCKTCCEIQMHIFCKEKMDSGFTKSEMKKWLGIKFCENAWRQMVAKSNRAIGGFWKFNHEDRKWYYY